MQPEAIRVRGGGGVSIQGIRTAEEGGSRGGGEIRIDRLLTSGEGRGRGRLEYGEGQGIFSPKTNLVTYYTVSRRSFRLK